MALQSEIYFDYGVRDAQKMMKVVDCRLVMDRDYDKHSPRSYMRLTRLDVTVSPDADDLYLHKWFADKNSIDLLLRIVLLPKNRDEEYQSIVLKGAVCCGLTERIDKVNPKKEKRQRLLTVGIVAEQVKVERMKLKYYEPSKPKAAARNQAPAHQQPPAQQQPAVDERAVEQLAAQLPDTLTEAEKKAIARHNIRLSSPDEYGPGLPLGKPMPIEEARKTNPHFVWKSIKNTGHKKEIRDVNVRDPKTGKMKTVRKMVEPKYIKNPNYDELRDSKYRLNCTTCSVTCVLRQQGFKVTAKGDTDEVHTMQLAEGDTWSKVWLEPNGERAKPTLVTRWMRKKHYDRMTAERYREFLEENTQEDGLYLYAVNWKGAKGKPGDGHATILRRWTDEKGTHLENIETQTGDDDSLPKLCGTANPWPGSICGIMRVDNKMLDPEYKDIFEI